MLCATPIASRLTPASRGFLLRLFYVLTACLTLMLVSVTPTKGFDQLMAMYEHYHVDECLLEVWADCQDLTTSQLITLSVNRSATPIVSRNDVLENRMASTYALAASQGGPAATYQRISVNPDKFLGMKSKDDSTWGSDLANPYQQVYFHASAMPIRETDTGEVYLTFKLTYKCTLREPKSVISS
uniref:Uncharacterized protein n=1 Tax=uncultured marine virus TaxID=186617 RepID=S4TDS2_9VIRU|nr:hypothetical protein [uncultured marine virus]